MLQFRLTSCLVFCILFCYCQCANNTKENDTDKNYNEFESVIERPCPYFDLYCIRQYLAKHSDCIIAQGPVPDPLFVPQLNVFVPNPNISVTFRNGFIKNLNSGIISEFYVNKVTDLLVLAVSFRNIADVIDLTLRYQRTGQEPAITQGKIFELDYPSYTITTVFRGIDHLRLEESESHTFLDTLPIFTVEPSVGISSDPSVELQFAELVALAPVSYQEAYLTATQYIIGNYIQYNICDFLLKLF